MCGRRQFSLSFHLSERNCFLRWRYQQKGRMFELCFAYKNTIEMNGLLEPKQKSCKTRTAPNKLNNHQDVEQTCWMHIKSIYTNHHLRRTCRYEVWDVIKCHKEPLTHALFDEIRLGLDYMNLWIVTSSSQHIALL